MLTSIRASLSGRYVIEQELGRGASAAVYLARDLKHGRRVALKVIAEDLTGSIGAARFLQEIRTTAGLNHPHILPLFDSGTADGLLYFTMPHVAGESLRARLDRRPALDRPEANRIIREMADAIAYAHSAGIVHRDLKPENVLLGPDGHVWIADFGLSRALSSAIDHRLSSRGLAVGSPAYMSPEQAAGDEHVDGRSDIYSLGCMAFELLTGEPPFRGNSVASLMAKHLSGSTPSARERNPTVDAAADAALRRAMARQPADRFGDAREFVRALSGDTSVVVSPLPTPRPRVLVRRGMLAAAAAAALLLLLYGLDASPLPSVFRGVTLDTSRYAVFPFEHAAGAAAQHEQQRMHEALAFWSGITMVDRFEVQDAIARAGGTVATVRDAKRIARELGAGRLVRGSVTVLNDSLVVYAALYDTEGSSAALADASVRLHAASADLEAHFIRLADALLFRGEAVPVRSNAASETDSRPALNAYHAAQDAIAEWDLTRADSLFAQAVTLDPDYSRASVWLAQTRFWRSRPPAEWRLPAERANERAEALPAREQQLLAAILSLAHGAYPEACAKYETLLANNGRDFAATYGLAECYRRDRLVLPDAASPTGWRFRSSGHQAVLRYKRAFEQLPSTHRAFRSGRFERLRDYVFLTAVTAHREGQSADGVEFRAAPSWEGDTLAFHPVAARDLAQGYWKAGPATETAIRMLRRMFFDVTTTWVAEYPGSAGALEAHAVALELLGDARALPTLREARRIATDSEHGLNLAISEFWLRFKHAVPRAGTELRAARLLADSILSVDDEVEPHTAGRMAAVAAVTGRATRAAQLSRVAAQEITRMPLAVSETGAALLAFAAVGGPVDSIAAAERAVERAIANTVPPEDAESVRQELLCRAASLSFPSYRMRIVSSPEGERDFLVAAFAAFARADHVATRATLDKMSATRSGAPPAEIEMEGLVPEAWLLFNMNDATAARALLDPTLDAVRYAEPPGGLESVASAGQLARALLLRAEIAHSLNDSESARLWALAFAELWSDADPSLRPHVARARQLVAGRND